MKYILCIGGPLDREHHPYEGDHFRFHVPRYARTSAYRHDNNHRDMRVDTVDYELECVHIYGYSHNLYFCVQDNQLTWLDRMMQFYAKSNPRNRDEYGYSESEERYRKREHQKSFRDAEHYREMMQIHIDPGRPEPSDHMMDALKYAQGAMNIKPVEREPDLTVKELQPTRAKLTKK